MKLLKHIQFSYFGTNTALKMKLLIILSIVACAYADKLDRTYLPPPNAGSAGGSPGSLIAPGLQPASSSGSPGSASFGTRAPTILNQGSSNGPAQNGQGFGPTGFGRPSGPSNFDSSNVGQERSPSGPQPGFSGNSAPNQGLQGKPGQGQQLSFGQSGIGLDFSKSEPSFGLVAGPALSGIGSSQGSRLPSGSQPSSFNQGLGFGQSNAYAVPQPERPQASADRNAEILKYDSENDGESYSYSYETSNGISAEESGVATNGVKAQGGYAYTGDDGYQYSVTYTADENGYQPQGEHLPTPHPIPEEILKSIEENAKAAAAGTQEGAYRPEEYESEDSLQQYKAGQSAYNRPQGQGQGIGINQPQGNKILGSQGISAQGYGQAQSSQAANQFSSGQNGFKGQGNQYQQNFDNQNQIQQGQRQDFSGQNRGQDAQGAQKNGYQYNQPQNGFGSSSPAGQRPSIHNRPQIAPQAPSSFAPSSSQHSGLSGKDTFGLSSNGRSDGLNIQGNQNQPGFDKSRPSYQQPGNQGSVSVQRQQPSFGSNQAVSAGVFKPGQQFSFESSQSSFGAGGITNQGQQAPFRSTQSSVGSSQTSFGPQKLSVSSNGASEQGYQYGLKANQPAFSSSNQGRPGSQQFGNKPSVNGGSSHSPSLVPGAQNGFSDAGARPQYQQSGNLQPSFGSNNLSEGSQSGVQNFGSSGAQSGSRGPQPGQQPQYQSGQQPSFGPSSSPNGRPSQAGSTAGSPFGGPRQPPSFSPQEGYKY